MTLPRSAALLVSASLVLFAALPAHAVKLFIFLTEGMPGQSREIPVDVLGEGTTVTWIENDISFAPPLRVQARHDGLPACENLALNADAAFTFIPSGCAGSDCTGVHAVVTTSEPVADIILYSCVVEIAPDTQPGLYPLTLSNVSARGAQGTPLPAVGESEGISVPERPKRATAVIGSAVGHPGELVHFDVLLQTTIGAQVVEITTSILYDPDKTPIVTDPNGMALCTVNPDIQKEGLFAGGQSLFASIDENITIPIPSGSRLYTCPVAISPLAPPDTYRLICTNATAWDLFSGLISTPCVSGQITVEAPATPNNTPTDTPGDTPNPSPRQTESATPIRQPTDSPRSSGGGCAIGQPADTFAAWLAFWSAIALIRIRGRT